MPGPPPAQDSQRRRPHKPKSYGAADPEVAGEAAQPPSELGFESHALIASLWENLLNSVESNYYSAADWDRVRLELWYGNRLLEGSRIPGAQSWTAFQSGLQALLVSPAEKRRVGIELKKAAADPDEESALADVAEFKRSLKSV